MDIDINININITVNGKRIPINIEGIEIGAEDVKVNPSKENLWETIRAYQGSLKKKEELNQ